MSFFKIISEIQPRGVGYAILSLLIEVVDEVLIIVLDEDQKEVLRDILMELKDQFESRRSETSQLRLRNFQILTEEEYYSKWEEYVGKRLIFVERDRNLISTSLDKLGLFIESMWRVRARDPIRRIALHMADILVALDVAKEHYVKLKELIDKEMQEQDPKAKKKLLKEIDKKKRELISMFEKRFSRREDIDLAFDLISFLVDKGYL